MKVKNKYVTRSHISEAKFRQIILLFSEDLSATQISHLTKLSRQTINKYLSAIRLRILELSQIQSAPLVGQIEVDESYFGAQRVRGKRDRGARGKTIVFGLLKRGGKVYTEIVPDCKSATLQRIIKGKTSVESVIHSDGWRGYNGLVDFGYKKHFRVHYSKNEFARGNSHINGDLCINRNNHQKPTFHLLGDFLNPALALLGQGLNKSPIGQKLDFANHSYLCKGL